MERLLIAFLIGVAGMVGVVGLSLGMNSVVQRAATEPVSVVAEIAPVARSANPPARSRHRAPAPQRSRKSAPSPSPMLAAGLSGLNFGFSDGADLAMADATRQLMGDLGGAVVDEADVQAPPLPIDRSPPAFPARARALGQSGSVTVSFVVDVDGSTQDVLVIEASAPGVFDDAVTDAVRTWRFNPGQQEGAPVAVRVRQTLRFDLQ